MANMLEIGIDTSTRDGRVRLINEMESGIYTGSNVDGEDCIVMLDKGVGMTIKRLQSNGYFECVDYDSNGYQECVYYER